VSAHSVAARRNDTARQGRHLYRDGYPDHQLPALQGLVSCSGLHAAPAFLVDERPRGFSDLGPAPARRRPFDDGAPAALIRHDVPAHELDWACAPGPHGIDVDQRGPGRNPEPDGDPDARRRPGLRWRRRVGYRRPVDACLLGHPRRPRPLARAGEE
jgi:hypothetical protein